MWVALGRRLRRDRGATAAAAPAPQAFLMQRKVHLDEGRLVTTSEPLYGGFPRIRNAGPSHDLSALVWADTDQSHGQQGLERVVALQRLARAHQDDAEHACSGYEA
jgi:hypothetical protein